MRASILFLLFSISAFGQKKPITLQALDEIGRLAPPGARGNPLAWSPDGTRFVYRQGARLMTFDAATQGSKELTDLDKLPTTKPVRNDTPQPFEWQNRRVSESPRAMVERWLKDSIRDRRRTVPDRRAERFGEELAGVVGARSEVVAGWADGFVHYGMGFVHTGSRVG